jgi:hypothetical protein
LLKLLQRYTKKPFGDSPNGYKDASYVVQTVARICANFKQQVLCESWKTGLKNRHSSQMIK